MSSVSLAGIDFSGGSSPGSEIASEDTVLSGFTDLFSKEKAEEVLTQNSLQPTPAQMEEGKLLAMEFRKSSGLDMDVTDPEIAAGAAIVMMIDNALQKAMLDAKYKAADIKATEKYKRDVEQKNIDNYNKAKKAALINKIFGWLKAIFMAIVAIAVAVVSFGTAAPAAAALMATAVVMAVWELTAQVANEASGGAAKIGLSDGFSKMFEEILKSHGMNEDKAKEMAGYLAMALLIVLEVILSFGSAIAARASVTATEKAANAAVGAAAAAGATKAGAKSSDQVAASATAKAENLLHEKIMNFYQATIDQLKRNITAQKWIAAGQVATASSAIGEGASSVALADIKNKLAQLKAELMEIEALIAFLIEQKKKAEEEVSMYVKIHADVVQLLSEITGSVAKRFDNATRFDNDKS